MQQSGKKPKVTKRGNIKNDVINILNENKAFKWMLNTGVVNYNSLSRIIQNQIKEKYNYTPKINTISTILRKDYDATRQKTTNNPFSDMKINIITGLSLLYCDYDDEAMRAYYPYSRAIRITPESHTMWVMISGETPENIKKTYPEKLYGDFIEINITIDREKINEESIQTFMETLSFNYINVSQLMISNDGFELFISARYLPMVLRLIEAIKSNRYL
ncbi:hypothetical protein ACLIKE_09515 [Ferroplasma acidiphilum]|jgi:hypothetical protein|uniref:Uncharacterized protein n=2 Tax=Ferroplasma TaxID=74968 RepID=S0AU41_FERAC|nr:MULTISPECIES: hypothetical protein [Ferroplasma]AGO61864.1 hypothetical protein FACI_IFERC00001G1888 [Ferroplasma acidarmanus Fer1]ARD84746.1 hypothetical protein FAD_0847 [Ferroplasma acidiphilum]NOL61069.1 hypothetical protein [Ferroplasma acidiphilum]